VLNRFLTALPLALGLVAAPSMAWGADVVDVRLGQHPDFTRLVFELDEASIFHVERAPDRGVVVVHLNAAAPVQRILWDRGAIELVEIESTGARAVAHVWLKAADAEVRPLLLLDPPRIVLDIGGPPPVAYASVDLDDDAAEGPAPVPVPAAGEEPAPEPPPVAAVVPAPGPGVIAPAPDAAPSVVAAEIAPGPDATPPAAPEPAPLASAAQVPETPVPVAAAPPGEVAPERETATATASSSTPGLRTAEAWGMAVVGSVALVLLGFAIRRRRRRQRLLRLRFFERPAPPAEADPLALDFPERLEPEDGVALVGGDPFASIGSLRPVPSLLEEDDVEVEDEPVEAHGEEEPAATEPAIPHLSSFPTPTPEPEDVPAPAPEADPVPEPGFPRFRSRPGATTMASMVRER
jgi:hypothetical protein